MADDQLSDPTEQSLWRPVRLLQAAIDAEIARVYADADLEGLKPSWVMELLRLHAAGPMTIGALAGSVQRTHSAMSQKVAAMRAAGWVQTAAGPDARSKVVALTPQALEVVEMLAAEWRATEAALAELEAEAPYPLSAIVADLQAALERRSFHDRLIEKLAREPAWAGRISTASGPPRAPGAIEATPRPARRARAGQERRAAGRGGTE